MSDFKVLSDIDHLRLRSGMYIGSSNLEQYTGFISGEWKTLSIIPGLLKIINEIIDNSVDEYIRTEGKFANKIDIKIFQEGLSGWKVSVHDNGRGIPVEKIDGEWIPVLAWTKARAGSNFNDDNRITAGMNGVGSFATNVFSNGFTGISSDGKNTLKVICERGVVSNTIVKKDTTSSRGTSVEFYPDLEFFSVNSISNDHIEFITDRLQNLSVCYKGIQFSINGKKIIFKNSKMLARTFSEHTVMVDQGNKLFVLGTSGEAQEYRHLTYVNGLNLKNGGTHTDLFIGKLIDELRPMIKRKWKIEVLPNQIKQHLFLASWISGFPNARFDSQTKERLTNSQGDVTAFLDDIDYTKLSKSIISHEDIINPIIESILYKKELADRAALARAQKKKKVKIVNHIEASTSNRDSAMLFITEGLSAIGPLVKVRNSAIHGGYSLKGKVLNVSSMKPIDIIKNKEISELMQVIGLEFGKSASDLNYGKICVMTDADVDGSSIFCLLLNFFRIWPEMFKNRQICRVETPRYIARKGKTEKWFYNDADFLAFDSTGYKIDYIKGLGTLDKESYKKIINTPVLNFVTMDQLEDLQHIDLAFSDSADARKTWMLNNE